MSQKRMIYQIVIPEPAIDSRTGQIKGTIDGRGAMVPVVDCPKPQFGKGCTLDHCCDCNQCKDMKDHYIVCGYQATPDEIKAMQQQQPGQPPQPVPQPQSPTQQGIRPPVPPGVFDPSKK